MIKRGKSLKSLFVLLLAFGIAFLFKIPTVYADSPHEFSFKFYDCDSLNESKLSDTLNAAGTRVQTQASVECLGPNGDGVTPEIQPTNVPGVGNVYKFEPGKVVKVGVHYVPGTVKDVGIGVKFFFDNTSYSAVHWNKYSGGTWSDKLAYTMNPDFVDWYMGAGWTVTVNHPTASPNKITMAFADSSGGGTTMEDEMDIVWYYFRTLDDATTNEGLDWTFDTSKTGISLSTKAPFTVTDAKTYIEVPLSEDNTLGSLSVKNGSTEYILDPEFTPGDENTDTYTAVVPNNITSVDISATANDAPRAILSGDTGTQSNLSVGNNQFTITVLSESGEPKDYTVNVYRLNNVATLSALNLSDVNYGTFNANTTSYTATVPYTTSSTNVTATVTANSKATIASGTGNKNLSVGSNTVSVVVNAENCKSEYSSVPGNTCTNNTYTVTVTRETASTVSTLNDLLVDNTRVKGFTPGDGTSTYTLDEVGYSKSSITIGYAKGEEHETVTGDGNKNLSVGMNSFDVVVTAQDGTTKTTYTIKVYRKNNNANLSGLNVTSSKAGSLSPAFSANTTEYTYNTDADETSVNISYTKADENATVVTTPASLTGINPRTTSSVTIEVTPEDTTQTKKTYTITFAVAKSSNANLSDLTVDGTTVENFNKDTTIYNITVPTDKDSVEIGATSEDDRVKSISNTGTKSLNYGENTIKVTVTAEDNTTKEYTLNITRTKKNIADLSDLKVDETSVPNFDKDTLVYTLDAVNYSKSSVNITYTKADTDATVTGDGNKNLSVGDNALKVTVTAQNGTDTKEYTINIHRKSNDASLSSLNVTSDPAGTLSPSFNASTYEYTYNVDENEDSVTVSGTPNHSLATVTEPQTVNPRTTSSVIVMVTAEDGLFTQPYSVTFDVAKSTNANLSDLTIDNVTIPGFDPDVTTYNISVGTDRDSILVGATEQDDRAEVTGDIGAIPLDYGDNTITITVTPEDPNASPKTYTVNVTRTKKDISTLSDLKVDGTSVPGFDKDTLEYTLDAVGNSKSSVNITYTKSDSDATVTGDGNRNLNVGENRLEVTVTAQNGTDTTTYVINIRRKSDDNTLKSLSVTSTGPGTLTPSFSPSTTEYIYTVGPDEDSVTVSGVANEEHATVTGGDTVNPRNTGSVILAVTPEDGTINYYTVTFDVTKSTNANLSDLTINGTTIEGFDPDVTDYTYPVDKDTDDITIGFETEDPHATVSVDKPEPLDYGENIITVTVTPEDPNGEPKVYTITVDRAKKTDATLIDIKVDGTSVPGFEATKYTYTLDSVAYDKASVNITVTTNDEDATVSGTGTRNLEVGDNALDVEVTAQDGTTKETYTINIRRMNNDTSLKSLTITSDPAGTLDKEFSPSEKTYTYTVDRDEDEVIITAEANGENATVTVVDHSDGKVNPQDVDSVQIMVTSENGETDFYTINIAKAKSDDANLDSLEVEGYDIGFDPDTLSYTLSVDSDVDSVNIIAHASDDPYATVSGDTGEQDLDYGVNTFTVTVTPEDPNASTKTYTITVNRALSADTKLSDLKVNGETIEGFDPDVPTYTYGPVSNDVTSLEIVGTPNGENATVEVEGNDNLVVGDNTITVTVTAQDGSKGTYTINVEREGNGDTTLSDLEVDGYDLEPEFDPDTTEYQITVPSDVDSVTVNATPNGENATVEVEGNENLQPGENIITVKVTAENGDTETYTITVTKEEEDDEKITSIEYGHLIEDGMIKSVEYQSVSETLKDQLDNDNDKLFIFDKNDAEEIAADKKLGTGMIIKLIKNGRENDRDFLVIKGDINGDGQIKVNDVVAAANQYLKSADPLEGPYFAACDIAPKDNPDGAIKVNDVVAVVNKYLGN